MLLIVPSTIVIPRDGSFALASLGRVRRVHDPVFSVALGRNNLALKRIVDLVSCRLTSFILIILSVFQSKFFSWSCRIEEVFLLGGLVVRPQRFLDVNLCHGLLNKFLRMSRLLYHRSRMPLT